MDLTIVMFAILLSSAYGAPQMRRHRRHYDDPFRPSKLPWHNSCGTNIKNDTADHRNRTAKPFKGLRNELPNYLVRFNHQRAQAIDTGDISQWFSKEFNSTYGFLAQINASNSNIHLRKRYIETQVYVGAFQYLRWKQLKHDSLRNESKNKTNTLEYLLILAKNLLCEIETAINNTVMKMPMILSRDAMDNRLTFRNNNRDRKQSYEVDEIDSKFAKIRFGEYLHGLDQILKNRMGKQHRRIGKKNKKMPKSRKSVTNVLSKGDKPIDNLHKERIADNDIDGSFLASKKHLAHVRNVNQRHRNRLAFNKKQRGARKQPQKVAGLGLNDLKNFRSQAQRNHQKSTFMTKLAGPIGSTTVAPQS